MIPFGAGQERQGLHRRVGVCSLGRALHWSSSGTGAHTGTVKSFGPKGYGFINMEDGKEMFFNVKDCVGSKPISGDTVRFDVVDSDTKPGQLKAWGLKVEARCVLILMCFAVKCWRIPLKIVTMLRIPTKTLCMQSKYKLAITCPTLIFNRLPTSPVAANLWILLTQGPSQVGDHGVAWVPWAWVAWVVWVQWVELWQRWAAKVGAGMVEKEPCQPCGTGAAKAGAMAGTKGWAKAMALLLRQHLLRLGRTRQVAAPKVAGEHW